MSSTLPLLADERIFYSTLFAISLPNQGIGSKDSLPVSWSVTSTGTRVTCNHGWAGPFASSPKRTSDLLLMMKRSVPTSNCSMIMWTKQPQNYLFQIAILILHLQETQILLMDFPISDSVFSQAKTISLFGVAPTIAIVGTQYPVKSDSLMSALKIFDIYVSNSKNFPLY